MKRIFAMFMAMAMAASLSVTAMAEDPTPAGVTDIKLGVDVDTEVALEDDLLTPGTEYIYPLMVTNDGADVELSKELMEGKKTSVSVTKGSSHIDSAKVVEKGGVYRLVIKTKASWGTKSYDAAVKVRLQEKSNSKEIAAVESTFKTGYSVMSDDYVGSLSQGEDVVVEPSAPIITKDQIEQIAKLNGYRNVTFTYGDWKYTVNPTGMGDVNLVSNNNVIKEILSKYEDQEFKFVTFPAGTDFGTNGKVVIDVDDVSGDFDGKYYVYRYDGSKLTSIKSTFDSDDTTLEFTAKALGRFVITNKQIKDGSVVVEGTEDEKDDEKNPDTGANDIVGVAAVLAVLSLVAAGAVSMKKSTK